MTEFTSERLTELKAVAEAAEPMMVFGGPAQPTFVYMEKSDVLSLIAALEAKTAEVESLAKEALHAMPDNRLGTLSSYIATLEQERDEARAEASKIEGRAVEWSKRAEKAEAALGRVQSTFFNNGLYLRIVTIPALNNEVGEVLYDRIRAQISKAIRRGRD